MIVDDSLMIRAMLRGILTEAGHEVVGEAADGLEAPDRVRELDPDIVTLDLVMPGRSGITTLQHLQMIAPHVRIVICSASLSENRVVEALRSGASGFVTKPLVAEKVLDSIAAVAAA
jgi:two-component system chemotaxis response regulator CheY